MKKNFNQVVECCVHAQVMTELFSGIKFPGSWNWKTYIQNNWIIVGFKLKFSDFAACFSCSKSFIFPLITTELARCQEELAKSWIFLTSGSNCNSMETKVLHKQRHQTARRFLKGQWYPAWNFLLPRRTWNRKRGKKLNATLCFFLRFTATIVYLVL